MSARHRYVLKYITLRFIPAFLIVGTLSTILIFLTQTNDNPFDLAISIVISATALTSLFAYFLFKIVNFLSMIKRQEKQYGVNFDDETPTVYVRSSLGIICSENWLICPGKLAIYRKEIKTASLGEAYYDRGATYPIRIKTTSGKVFCLNFKDENMSGAVRKWARR